MAFLIGHSRSQRQPGCSPARQGRRNFRSTSSVCSRPAAMGRRSRRLQSGWHDGYRYGKHRQSCQPDRSRLHDDVYERFPPTRNGGPSVNVLLNGSGSKITLTHSPTGTVAPGTAITLTAKVAVSVSTNTATPTGTVTFEDSDGTILGSTALSGGTASLTVPNLGSGQHVITALYSGDSLFQPNTMSGFTVRVSGVSVVLTAPSTITTGKPLTFTVTVGTAGSKKAPVGTASIYAVPPGGSPMLVTGPRPVVDNGNGTSGLTGTTTAGPPGVYTGYAIFTPTNTKKPGSSPNITVTVTP